MQIQYEIKTKTTQYFSTPYAPAGQISAVITSNLIGQRANSITSICPSSTVIDLTLKESRAAVSWLVVNY